MIRFKNILILLLLISSVFSVFAQVKYPPRLWKLTNYSGEAKIHGTYREQESVNLLRNTEKFQEVYGGLSLKTTSYMLNPRFVVIDAGGEYNPGKMKLNQLVFPDQGEERKMYSANLQTHFFREQPVNFGASANISSGFINRENITDMQTNALGYGGFLNVRNKWFPLEFTINKQESSNKEILTGRMFTIDQLMYQARGAQSFNKYNKAEIRYNHNDNKTVYFSSNQVRNISDMLFSNYEYKFGQKRDNVLRSGLNFHNRGGSMQFQRWTLAEQVLVNLPHNLTSSGEYNFNKTIQGENKSNQHSIRGGLAHRYYRSFTTKVSYDYSLMQHSMYDEYSHKPAFDILYEKILPKNCHLTLSYNIFKQYQNNVSDPVMIQILNESVTITDGQMLLLSKPDIDVSTVVVSDVTGVIVFQNNLDYVLILRGIYIEIQRIPGGQIVNNASLNISYKFLQNKSYHYNVNGQGFNGSVTFLKNTFEIFYSFQKSNYSDIVNMDVERLNYFIRTSYGLRVNYKFLKSGIEFTEYQSRLIPYKSERYYLMLNKQFFQKLNMALNGNYSVYHYSEIYENQEFADIAASIGYKINANTDINIESSYRKQSGRQIDLDLFIARMKFNTSYGKMFFSCGADIYRRLYIGEKLNFNSVFVQLSRRF